MTYDRVCLSHRNRRTPVIDDSVITTDRTSPRNIFCDCMMKSNESDSDKLRGGRSGVTVM